MPWRRTGLTGLATPSTCLDVERRQMVGQGERLARDHAARSRVEELAIADR